MSKTFIYLSFLLMLLSSCEEYYTPDIDTVEGQLVIEAMITNDPARNFVHLTKTRSFYDQQAIKAVTGASVELVETNSKVVTKGVENVWGYFYFNMVPTVGKIYKLRIYLDNLIYESEVVTMPPLPTISNFYTENVVRKKYTTNGAGVPFASEVQGREIYADLPGTNTLSYYRFSTRSIIEWVYNAVSTSGPPPPAVYGWKSFYENSQFNLAGPKKFSQIGNIEKHPLLMLTYKSSDYLLTDTLVARGWILIIDQFGTSKGSFEYHEKLNSQFAADGSLFDPIQTQVYGNIKCITDPTKIVFGYFDMNSFRQHRYYLEISGPTAPVVLRQVFRYPNIPDEGQIKSETPAWWE